MSGIKTPVNQKRLTNIAIVKYKSHGKRFEIACYRNKVLNWREGIEKELDEVIQTDTVFENVGKGIVAKEKDMMKSFGTTDNVEICKKILKTGELQVSDKEREVHTEGLFRDIVQVVVERCVHPQTGRMLTSVAVENALRKSGFSTHVEGSAKKQGLRAIEMLVKEMPENFARAKMRLRLAFPETLHAELLRQLTEDMGADIEEDAPVGGGVRAVSFRCDPCHYRELDRLATVAHAGEGVSLQIVTATVTNDATDLGGVARVPVEAAAAVPRCPPAEQAAPAPRGVVVAPKGIKCSACAEEFADAGEYRLHCKGDRHAHNLKRKVKGLGPVTDEEFAEISLDAKEGFRGID